ncbi:MAG: DUF190 domain-containing protein [Lentisphaerae bacterium]|nr:DUF190 domain-containing protein [Lentisphaerota bacterium]
MALAYRVIDIFTSEDIRHRGLPLHQAVLRALGEFNVAARCIVTRGVAGRYESGETATDGVEVLSFNMPLKLEIILPAAELERVLAAVEPMVTDGIVAVRELDVRCHRTMRRLIPRQMRVRDAMTATPRRVHPETPASAVAHLLISSTFHSVPVVNSQDKPVGIITHGDLLSRGGLPLRAGLLSTADDKHRDGALAALEGKSAADLMSQPPVTVMENQTLSTAVDLMLARQLKRLPVVHADGSLCGMLARLDVFRVISKSAPPAGAVPGPGTALAAVRDVRDIMRRDTHEVSPQTSIEEVLRIIDDSDIQRVAVVDGERHLLGLISDRALLAAFANHHAGFWGLVTGHVSWVELAQRHAALTAFARARTAADVMQRDLETVREDTPVEYAIRLMAEKGIKRLPVVDEAGVFRGLVSRDALLRAGLAAGTAA